MSYLDGRTCKGPEKIIFDGLLLEKPFDVFQKASVKICPIEGSLDRMTPRRLFKQKVPKKFSIERKLEGLPINGGFHK